MLSPTANARWGCRWFWLAVGLLGLVATFALDEVVDRRLLLPRHQLAWQAATCVSIYGDWLPVSLAGVAGVVILSGIRKFAAARLLLLILVAGLVTGLGSAVIRSSVGRTRPSATVPQGFYGPRRQGKWIIGQYQFGSFPSSHTAVWAGLAGAAWWRRRSLAIAFVAGALVVAWSRLALGCHHLSDVTASVIWGFAVGPWLCDRLERAINRGGE